MRVPELDWPNNLFKDVLPAPDQPMTVSAQVQAPGQPLWTALRGRWLRTADSHRESAGPASGYRDSRALQAQLSS